VGGDPAKGSTVTITMFEALDALSQEMPHDEHQCGEHDDVCGDTCPIASAVISAEGLE
jgi:hypothetical protein